MGLSYKMLYFNVAVRSAIFTVAKILKQDSCADVCGSGRVRQITCGYTPFFTPNQPRKITTIPNDISQISVLSNDPRTRSNIVLTDFSKGTNVSFYLKCHSLALECMQGWLN